MKDHVKIFLKTALWLLSAVLFALTGYYMADIATEDIQDVDVGIVRLSPACKVEFVYRYEQCAHTESVYADTREYIGLSEQELRGKLSTAIVTEFCNEYAKAEYTLMQYCPLHPVLFLDGNTLLIKETVSGTDELCDVKRIGIEKDNLPLSERNRLSSGVVFGSYSELNKYIASLR